jgi:hypothetical protein
MYLSNGQGLGAVAIRRNPVGRIIPIPAVRARRLGFGYFPGDPTLYYDPTTGSIVAPSTPGAVPVLAQGAPGYSAAPYGSPQWLAQESTYVNGWIAGAPAGSNPSYPGQAPPAGAGSGGMIGGAGIPTLINIPPDQMPVAMAAGYNVGGPGNPPPSSGGGSPAVIAVPAVYTPPVQPAATITLNSPLPAPAPSVSVASYPPATPSAVPALSSPVQPAVQIVSAPSTGNPVTDFLSSSLAIGGYQVPLWLAGVVAVGGVFLLTKGGK